MKKTLLFPITLIVMSALLLSGCRHTPQRVIGMVGEFKMKKSDNAVLMITNNTAESRFEIRYTFENDKKDKNVSFIFYFSSLDKSIPSWDPRLNDIDACPFQVTDDSGEAVVFGEDGYYCFSGEKTIYIIYEQSPEKVKDFFSRFVPSDNPENSHEFSLYINDVYLVDWK